MKQCTHPLTSRAYGSVLVGSLHREVELCQECRHFRLVLDPLRGWLRLSDELIFEREPAMPHLAAAESRLFTGGPAAGIDRCWLRG